MVQPPRTPAAAVAAHQPMSSHGTPQNALRPRSLLIVLALYAVSCSPRSASPDLSSMLRIGVGLGNTARETSLSSLADVLYAETLLNREWDGRTTDRLATDFRWEQAGRLLRLSLKKDVRFHDGTALTSALVSEYLATKMQTPGRDAAWGFGFVTSITSADPLTVVIHLSQPDMFLLGALSDLKIVHPSAPEIATGPFKLVTKAPTVETLRFEEYHAGPSPLAGVRVITYDTQRSAWAALLRGEVDVVQEVSRESVQFIEGGSTVRTFSSVQPFYIPLVFNHHHRILKNVEVRRAISEALDRDDIVSRAMQGRGRVADAPIWPFHWAYTTPARKYTYDPTSAKARLDRAGFPQGASRVGAARSRFSIKCLIYSEDPQYERIALMVQRQLFDIGVNLEIQLLPYDELLQRVASGDFEAYIMRANASRTLERTYRGWRSTRPDNRATLNTGYSGADELLDQLRRSTTDAEIRTTLAALSERFYQDAPAAFIAWLEVTRAVDSRFSIGNSRPQDPFVDLWQWRPEAKQ